MKTFQDCQVERRYLARRFALDLATGRTVQASAEWRTGACAVPLFSEVERRTGVCRRCAGGFQHPENHTTEAGALFLKEASRAALPRD